MREVTDADGWELVEEALNPPNLINPATGVPFSWDDGTDELDGF
jgi:hypothetical protein